MRDLVHSTENFDLNDVNLLKLGRHFRLSPRLKAVVGRDDEENRRIKALIREGDVLLEVKSCGSPVTLLRGDPSEGDIRLAVAITVRYSDAKMDGEVSVLHGTDRAFLHDEVSSLGEKELTELRL